MPWCLQLSEKCEAGGRAGAGLPESEFAEPRSNATEASGAAEGSEGGLGTGQDKTARAHLQHRQAPQASVLVSALWCL